ncbi:MAG TPA: bifunctional DNA-formamidopyrimidine glycosylase/DNA-(apurinic or apyrimidinic site) lyase [Bacillota bacterium]|nr:bifunctional DNA-formamidopyrimidine glycosylase/DNA-(apurinic or apyrimidinic site) lyase [Bacillota bacterium]
MPELPEVETIRRGLEPLIVNKVFTRPVLLFPGSIRYPEPDRFCEQLEGRRIIALKRHGKYLLLELNCGLLAVHLRMTGRLVYLEKGGPPSGHLRVVLPFQDGSLLYFSDMRKFGGLWLLDNKEDLSPAGMHRLGPDIYEQVTEEEFLELLQKRPRSRLKPLLLDQFFVAGLGNIYVDESLHRCRLHPCREAGSLSREEGKALFRAIREVLEEGIRCGGTTSRDYRDARGEKGTFQEQLAVYGRKGSPCRCGTAIERIVVAGRGTYYCPRCQAEKRGDGRQ